MSGLFGGGSVPQRNLTQEMKQTAKGYTATAPDYLALNQQYQPLYNLLGLGVRQQNLFGTPTQPGTLGQNVAANTFTRGSDIADVQRYGPDSTAAFLAANPGLGASLSTILGGLTPTGLQGDANRAARGGLNTPGVQGSGLLGQLGDVASQRLTGGNQPTGLLAQLGSSASQGLTGPSDPILAALQNQARSQLAAGGTLTPEEQRIADQQMRAGFAARGMTQGNQSLAAELLNRDALQRQRIAAAQQLGTGVEGLTQADLAARRGFAGNVAGLLQQYQTGQQGFETGIAGLQQAQTGLSLQDQQQRNQFALGTQQANQAQQDYAGRAAQIFSTTLSDPFQAILGRTSGAGGGGGGAGGYPQQIGTGSTMFDPTNAYASDLYNSNFNASNAQNIASQNQQAALGASAIGSSAAVLAAILPSLIASDKRLKTNIRRVGKTPGGVLLSSFSYKGDETRPRRKFIGAVAQDVEKIAPRAVIRDPITGYRKLNYGAIDAPFMEIAA
jgi:hypothetical protein